MTSRLFARGALGALALPFLLLFPTAAPAASDQSVWCSCAGPFRAPIPDRRVFFVFSWVFKEKDSHTCRISYSDFASSVQHRFNWVSEASLGWQCTYSFKKAEQVELSRRRINDAKKANWYSGVVEHGYVGKGKGIRATPDT